jgi:hypothetical protein
MAVLGYGAERITMIEWSADWAAHNSLRPPWIWRTAPAQRDRGGASCSAVGVFNCFYVDACRFVRTCEDC